ncbi:MAG TPA: hypothetical protein VMV77_04735 [Bacteroidales bacterium]|nr:hypothetical protein [Bacteroidales bacterium]
METTVKEQNGKIHWRKVFLSDYLGSCDLEDGKDLKAIIKSVTIRNVKGPDGKEQDRNVATFTDASLKPMILNATNCKLMKKFAKSVFINDWNNIPIQIYVKDDIKAFGEITEGLRIRPSQPSMAKPKLTPASQAWTKAIEFLKGSGTMDAIKTRYEISKEDEEILKNAVI